MNAWLRRKTSTWLDLQGGNLLFGAEFALMFLSLFALVMLGCLAMTVDYYSVHNEITWTPLLGGGLLSILITVPWGLYAHFLGNKAAKEDPPVRLNRQRREVAIPRWVGDAEFKLRFWNNNAGLIAYIVLIGTLIFVLVPFMQEYSSVEYRNTLVFQALIVLAIEIVVIGIYISFALHLIKKHGPRLVYEIYPWEKLVAFIETKDNLGPGLMLTSTVLTLAVPKPDDPESALAAASINVGHETAGLAQWECIRRFMEDGPEACPDPRNDDTLANYKLNCRKAKKEMSFLPWVGKKIGDWFFQRYLAHIITERRTKTVSVSMLPKEVRAWSEPLPVSQWAHSSTELQAANLPLVSAYEGGLRFTEMGPLSAWQAERDTKSEQQKDSSKKEAKWDRNHTRNRDRNRGWDMGTG